MKSAMGWSAFVAILAVGVGVAYFGLREYPAPSHSPVLQPSVAPPGAVAPPQQAAEGEIRAPHYPIEQVKPPAEAALPSNEKEELPALAESDGLVGNAVSALVADPALRDVVVVNSFIRQIVATVDNLPREKVARRMVPLKPVAGSFLVVRQGEDLVLSPENEARYTPYVRLAEAVDAARLAAVYAHLYPLFDEAYRDLGYPDAHFNDRLVQVIDHLLATPRVDGPVRLVQPKVMYEFADPRLAGLSAGQKALTRMGTANAERIKAKLREIRVYLTGGRARAG